MAQISFDAVPESAVNGTSGQFNNVDFFNLRNDGDEAIVRIMHDTTDSFNIFAVHDRVSVGGKTRKVNCIRDPKEPTENCPLCASGSPLAYRMFINMTQYFTNAQGAIESKPVVWERGIGYATKLKTMIENYGPLSECLMKIKRNGAAGSQDTTYEILYCPPKMYPDEMYPVDKAPFEKYSALGSIIMNKNFQELTAFLQTGTVPAAANNTPTAAPAPAPEAYQPKEPTVTPQTAPWVAPAAPTAGAPETVTAPSVTAAPSAAPGASATGRPSRYY